MGVSALFVDSGGIYSRIGGVVCWGVERDARLYDGQDPVVCHPPCNLWVNFAALNYKRYGGDHNIPGADGGAFRSALASVRRCGGVLEHPAFSKAWVAHGLTRPCEPGWTRATGTEWVCEVWQSAYGHKARKRTWLLYVSQGEHAPHELAWEREPGSAQCGWFDRNKPTLGKKAASATPPAFAAELVALALRSGLTADASSAMVGHRVPLVGADNEAHPAVVGPAPTEDT